MANKKTVNKKIVNKRISHSSQKKTQKHKTSKKRKKEDDDWENVKHAFLVKDDRPKSIDDKIIIDKKYQEIIEEMLELYGLNFKNIKNIFFNMTEMFHKYLLGSFKKSLKVVGLLIKLYCFAVPDIGSDLLISIPGMSEIGKVFGNITNTFKEKTKQILKSGKMYTKKIIEKVGNYIEDYFIKSPRIRMIISITILCALISYLNRFINFIRKPFAS